MGIGRDSSLSARTVPVVLFFLTAAAWFSASVQCSARALRRTTAYPRPGTTNYNNQQAAFIPATVLQPPYNNPSTGAYNNPCASNPCRYGGICRPTGSSFTCQCSFGYSGQLCDTTDRCLISNPCLNGGRCQPAGSYYTCSCLNGYSGTNCELRDACRLENPCRNGGQCIATGPAGWYCRCLYGYSGPQCDMYNACLASNPCLNGGLCQPQGAAYWCICRRDFQGQRCEYPTPATGYAG